MAKTDGRVDVARKSYYTFSSSITVMIVRVVAARLENSNIKQHTNVIAKRGSTGGGDDNTDSSRFSSWNEAITAILSFIYWIRLNIHKH